MMMYYMGSRLLFNSDSLIEFLINTLQAKDITEQLLEARDIVKACCMKLEVAFSGMRRLNLANSLLGAVVNWGILYAVTRHFEISTGGDDSRAAYLAKEIFMQKIQVASNNSPNESAVLETSEILNIVDGYDKTIGNVEQTLPGEEWSLDPFLQRNPT